MRRPRQVELLQFCPRKGPDFLDQPLLFLWCLHRRQEGQQDALSKHPLARPDATVDGPDIRCHIAKDSGQVEGRREPLVGDAIADTHRRVGVDERKNTIRGIPKDILQAEVAVRTPGRPVRPHNCHDRPRYRLQHFGRRTASIREGRVEVRPRGHRHHQCRRRCRHVKRQRSPGLPALSGLAIHRQMQPRLRVELPPRRLGAGRSTRFVQLDDQIAVLLPERATPARTDGVNPALKPLPERPDVPIGLRGVFCQFLQDAYNRCVTAIRRIGPRENGQKCHPAGCGPGNVSCQKSVGRPQQTPFDGKNPNCC